MALSPIELDYTLQELSNLDGGDAHSLTPHFPESPETHGSSSTSSSDSLPMRTSAWQPPADAGSTLEMVRNARNCMSHSIAFVAGAMDLRLFEVQQTESKTRCSGLPIPETVTINSVVDADSAYSLRVEDATRMLCAVKLRPLPFVVKVPYSAGGEAVFIIRDKCARKACIETLEQNLPNYLPTSILVQDFIPGKSFGISLFITNNGRPIFIACTEAPQTERSTSHMDWPGDFVEYSSQEDLRKRYKAIIEQVGKCVFSQGYTGPLHFDVITTDEGRDFVINLNPRPSASYVLGVLRTHCWLKNGLAFATLMSWITLPGSRDWFETLMKDDIAAGKTIIIGWCHGELSASDKEPYSTATIVVAETTRPRLMEVVTRVKAHALV